MTSTRTIAIKTSDDKIFQVPVKVLSMSDSLKSLLDSLSSDELANNEALQVPNVDGKTMEKVLEWCEKHCDDPELTEEERRMDKRDRPIGEWDKEYLKMTEEMLYNVYLSSDHLKIEGLMDLCALFIARLSEGKTTAEIGEIYGIECDLTPEEQEQILKENEWMED